MKCTRMVLQSLQLHQAANVQVLVVRTADTEQTRHPASPAPHVNSRPALSTAAAKRPLQEALTATTSFDQVNLPGVLQLRVAPPVPSSP